ncbi:MAG: hypothetical protein M9894_32170 [Planctomycetes bacterium]|nr:hypothetical protein [Planctomycetota bacterium]
MMLLGALAVTSAASGLAGCSGSKKTTIIGGTSVPTITGLSTQAAMTDGNDPTGNPIRLQIRGDDFLAGAQVRLRPKGALQFDTSIAGVDSFGGGFLAIPAANVQFHDQSRIDIIALPASPILGNNGEGTVIVQVVNPGGVASTDGTADGSATHDELTYYHNQGLQVTVGQIGPLAGAWNNVYPGQSGVELQATITNMTQEPIQSIAITNRALDFGTHSPHALNYIMQEPATTLAVGANTTVRFLAAFSNELPEGSVSASCAVSAVGATSGRSYTTTGGASMTAGSTPTINKHARRQQRARRHRGGHRRRHRDQLA